MTEGLEHEDLTLQPAEDEDHWADNLEETNEGQMTAPELMTIFMPSSLQPADLQRLGLEPLAEQEMELRQGQANDALEGLRLALGHKALLYRSQVRNIPPKWIRLALTLLVQLRKARSNKQDTAARRDIKRAEDNVQRHFRAYRRARTALQRLKAPNEVINMYKPIFPDDLAVTADVVEENRIGQRSHTLAWFWHIRAPNGDQRDEWMEECESSNEIASYY